MNNGSWKTATRRSNNRRHTRVEAPVVEPTTKPLWGDDEPGEPPIANTPVIPDVLPIGEVESILSGCNFNERMMAISSAMTVALELGIKMIKEERDRIDMSHNEKEFVRDLCNICAAGKTLVESGNKLLDAVMKNVAVYESEKNSALDGLKTFLASIDHSMVPAEVKKADPGAYSAAAAGKKTPPTQQLMASVPLGPGSMVLPMTRDRSDIGPMNIKYASDLGVFLINMDGKLYSFCNGVFISRVNKTGDNTLYGKRCNPVSTKCIGTNCTYYHDPLMHSTGHTMRNMGVHYVISELINGIANDAEITETARGKNKFIVEDIISLAGMLLIKAFQVKKIRDSL